MKLVYNGEVFSGGGGNLTVFNSGTISGTHSINPSNGAVQYASVTGNTVLSIASNSLLSGLLILVLRNNTTNPLNITTPSTWIDSTTGGGSQVLILPASGRLVISLAFEGSSSTWHYTSSRTVATDIIDSSSAGRAMLTAADTIAQAGLLLPAMHTAIATDLKAYGTVSVGHEIVSPIISLNTTGFTTIFTPPAGQIWILESGNVYIESWTGTSTTAATTTVRAGSSTLFTGVTLSNNYSSPFGFIPLSGVSAPRPVLSSSASLVVDVTAMSGGSATGSIRFVGSLRRVK